MPPRGCIFALALLSCHPTPNSEPSYCDDHPWQRPDGWSASLGTPTRGALLGGVRLGWVASDTVGILPRRHVARCLDWTTQRLAAALHRAAARAGRLSVGNLSRAAGGPLAYSRSHESGRDADVAFLQTDRTGLVTAPHDLVTFGADLYALDTEVAVFDVARNWRLVEALLDDPGIEVQWLFIEDTLRFALLEEARRRASPLLPLAEQRLHQPSDAPPHNDHLHVRIACTQQEAQAGCRD